MGTYLYDANSGERSCLDRAIKSDPNMARWVAGALKIEGPLIVILGNTTVPPDTPQLTGFYRWYDTALGHCLSTASLSGAAAELALEAAGRPDTDQASRSCLKRMFAAQAPEAIDAYRRSVFVENVSGDLNIPETTWAKQVEPGLLAACHLAIAH